MLGLTRKQARERFDEIIAFAELEEFVDLKLKNYSSGMSVRLAFSVAIQVDADVLLVDEVLAVGDAAFQQKCFEQFQRLKREGKTIVFVTHDMGAVERFCDRAMLLERGEMRLDRRAARDRARLQRAQLRPPAVDDGARATTAATATARRREIQRRLVRGRRRRADHGARPGRAAAHVREVRFHERVEHPIFALPPAQRAAPHDLRHVDSSAPRARPGTFERRRRRAWSERRARRTGSRPAATRSRRRSRGRARRRRARLREDLARCVVHGRAADGRHRRAAAPDRAASGRERARRATRPAPVDHRARRSGASGT